MINGEYIMNTVDVFMWIVIGGSIAIVFIMFLWSINALARLMRFGRGILRRKHKRKRRVAGHNRPPRAAVGTQNCRWQQSERK